MYPLRAPDQRAVIDALSPVSLDRVRKAISPCAPAIRMAVYNACGIKLNEYPFTPGLVLAALKSKEAK